MDCFSSNLSWRDVQHLIVHSSNSDVPRSDDWLKNAAGIWGEYSILTGLHFARAAWSTEQPPEADNED